MKMNVYWLVLLLSSFVLAAVAGIAAAQDGALPDDVRRILPAAAPQAAKPAAVPAGSRPKVETTVGEQLDEALIRYENIEKKSPALRERFEAELQQRMKRLEEAYPKLKEPVAAPSPAPSATPSSTSPTKTSDPVTHVARKPVPAAAPSATAKPTVNLPPANAAKVQTEPKSPLDAERAPAKPATDTPKVDAPKLDVPKVDAPKFEVQKPVAPPQPKAPAAPAKPAASSVAGVPRKMSDAELATRMDATAEDLDSAVRHLETIMDEFRRRSDQAREGAKRLRDGGNVGQPASN